MQHTAILNVITADNVDFKKLEELIINRLICNKGFDNSISVVQLINQENTNSISSYIALPWPEYQAYMDKDWFLEESYYDSNKDTYLIPKERYDASI